MAAEDTMMKTLQRLLLSGVLVGLAVLSTALAGSAYGGATSSRSQAGDTAGRAFLAEAPARAYLCRVDRGDVTGCAPIDVH